MTLPLIKERPWVGHRDLDQNAPLAGRKSTLSRKDLKLIVNSLLNMPYEATLEKEPEFKGLTYQEVMIIRQLKRAAVDGDQAAFKEIMDRAHGKPTQFIDETHRDETLADFLENMDDVPTDNRVSGIN